MQKEFISRFGHTLYGGDFLQRYINRIYSGAVVFLLILNVLGISNVVCASIATAQGNTVTWAKFDVPLSAMKKSMDYDIKTYDSESHTPWTDILALLASRYYGEWGRYKAADMEKLFEELKNTAGDVQPLVKNQKLFEYYREVYNAVLGGFLKEYLREIPDGEGGKKTVLKYGFCAYMPIAEGYGYSHYDDFGDSRSYGYKRSHLGNDLLGSVGTPITAVEGGTVEVAGWNRFGGFRIGIRSFDKKRYYYYAHLRSDKPFHSNITEGATVKAGDVIGYLGMTGYSSHEGTNGMTKPHLHFGMQLIFDESQKDGVNEIWIDVYNIVNLLEQNRATVQKDTTTGDYNRVYDIFYLTE